MVADQRQDHTATQGCYNLRNADGAVKQAEVGTHVTIALQGIGNEGERHSQHGSPSTADEQEGHELQILVVQERHHGKAHGS